MNSFKTFVVEAANSSLDRGHDVVADEITAVFTEIRQRHGSFVTAMAFADKTQIEAVGGHPDGALYIVADIPRHISPSSTDL